MPRFKNTNVIINFDEAIVRAEDPQTKKTTYTADPVKAAAQWEADITGALERLYTSSGQVSRLLFDAIQKAGFDSGAGKYARYLVIRPYSPADEKNPNFGVCNAYAGPENYGLSGTTARFDNTASQTKGLGSTTVIRYDKARWVNGTKCAGLAGQPGGTFHEILLYEMLHGLRQMAGQQDMSQLQRGWTSMEEFYAILIANVAMSEQGRKQFRKNHAGFGVLEPNLSTSVGFLTDPDHLKWVDWLYTRNAVFLRRVAEVPAPFNPIREFIQNLPAWKVVLANPLKP